MAFVYVQVIAWPVQLKKIMEISVSMTSQNKVQETDVKFRVKQLRDLCDNFLQSPSDEFYGEADKIANIGHVSQLLMKQAAIELGA